MIRALHLVAVAILVTLVPSAAAAPVSGQQPNLQLVPQTVEAKFPLEDPEFVRALQDLNAEVNHAIAPTSDAEQYGVDDMWVMAPPSMKGDCEDYVMTKIFLLGRAGVPIVTDTKFVMVVVPIDRDGTQLAGHAILAVRMPNGSVAYLDNLNEQLMTKQELVALGYKFFDW